MPCEISSNRSKVSVVTGVTNQGTQGIVQNVATDPLFLDIELKANQSFIQDVAETHSCFIYVLDGVIQTGNNMDSVETDKVAIMGAGTQVEITAANKAARCLLVAARQLPVKAHL